MTNGEIIQTLITRSHTMLNTLKNLQADDERRIAYAKKDRHDLLPAAEKDLARHTSHKEKEVEILAWLEHALHVESLAERCPYIDRGRCSGALTLIEDQHVCEYHKNEYIAERGR